MKALIVYGTRYGSTSKIAEFISNVLKEERIESEIIEVTKKQRPSRDLGEYDLIIVGSAIRMGKWTNEALDFVKTNERKLAEKRSAFFVSCATARDAEKRPEVMRDYLYCENGFAITSLAHVLTFSFVRPHPFVRTYSSGFEFRD